MSPELRDLEILLEGSAAKPAPPAAGAAVGGQRCPRGYNKDPNSGKCVPRDQLRLRYRGHEPMAALHREKAANYAAAAEKHRAAGDHDTAAKAEKLSANHMEKAKWHNAQMHAVGRVLYPRKYAAMADPTKRGIGKDRKVMELPQFQAPKVGGFGGQNWGGQGGSRTGGPTTSPNRPSAPPASPPRSPSTPGYNPFGAGGSGPAGAAPAPDSGDKTQVDPADKTQPGQPSILHRIGHAIGHGLKTAAHQKAAASGGHLGWSTLAHGIDALLGGTPSKPLDIGTAPTVQAQRHDPTVPDARPGPSRGGSPRPGRRPKTDDPLSESAQPQRP